MRLSTSAAVLALGAAASAALEQQQQQQQIVLGNKDHHGAPLGEPQFGQEPLGEGRMPTHATEEQRLLSSIGGADADGATAWDAIRDRIPHADFLAEAGLRDDVLAALRTAARGIPPKPVTRRRHDSEWDYVMHGRDVQAQWVDGATADAPRRRKVGGHLESYKLRAKKVDPSKLGVDDAVKQYSGYLDDNEKDKHLFYWFFESRNDPKNDPVVLWLNGGPGCSSLTGLFAELGPSMIRKDGKIHPNPSSWNSNASVIFMDQPVNVGFSYSGSSVSSTVVAGQDVYALLTLFFEQFPEYATQPFHIAGESYAGHYIPVFASEILSHEHRNINLKSVLIGNGLTDGLTQYAYYRPMACGEGGYPARLQPAECESMDKALPRCQSLIESCYQSGSVWSCVPASIYCNNAMIGPYQRTGFNVYDIRSPCEDTSSGLCYLEMKYVAEYLNQANVRDAVGAEVDSYDSCNMDINRNFLFAGDWFQPFHRLVPDILEKHKLPVLVYAGDADFICNWLGNQAWTNQLDWAGHDGFSKAEIKDLKLESHNYGKVKSDGKLTFMQIYQAGHMVPMNQPEASLDFVNRWLGGEWAKKA